MAARAIAAPKPWPRCSALTPSGSISPGLPVPADHTVVAATAVAASIAAGQTVAPSVLAEPAEADAAASPAPTESAAPEETSTPSAAPLTHDEASTLRALMRSVVVDGSASELKAREPAVAAKTLLDGLRARGILVRWWDRPRISNHLRITVGTDGEMDALLSALEELVP